jgi:hypothetical protein
MNKNEWLNSVKRRLAEATPGPWYFINDNKIPKENRIESHSKQFICKGAEDTSPWNINKEDGEFIANARTDIELLIQLLENYEQRIAQKNSTSD